MTLRILYFATIRDVAGVREETVTLPEGSRVEDLKQHLGQIHPQLLRAFDSAIFAVNREFAFDDHPLREGDEVAIFPPVSGGSGAPPTIIRTTRDPLDLNALLKEVITSTAAAACALTGVVQGLVDDKEPPETISPASEGATELGETQMAQIAWEIRERWSSVEGVAIVQRIGEVQPGIAAVMVVCAAAYRDTAVHEAARYGLDRLKQIIPYLGIAADQA